MKNKLGILLAGSAMTLGLSLPCFADQIQGLVESTDSSNHSIRIKDPASGFEKTLQVHPKAFSEVKNGSVVKATFESGSATADTLEVLIAR